MRFLSWFMSAVLVFGLIPSVAWAKAPGSGDGAALAAGGMTVEAESNESEAGGVLDALDPADAGRSNLSVSDDFTAQSIGVGGHGATFDPVISPHDPKTFVVDCDMGGIYVTHDEGANWEIKNCRGRIWDIKADPKASAAGTFYAGGSGLWRSTDYGDNWELLWPNPEKILATRTKQLQTRSFYYTSDSYPNGNLVEAIAVDAERAGHLVVVTCGSTTAASYNGRPLTREVFESTDNGATFALVASFDPVLDPIDSTCSVNNHVFIEPAPAGKRADESRIVVSDPDGVFEVNRSTKGVTELYASTTGERLIDCAQVRDNEGAHYVMLETANSVGDVALEKHTRVRLWHTSDFNDADKAVDLTDEFVESMPREYNTNMDVVDAKDENGKTVKKRVLTGTDYEITAHNALAICVPSMERIYISYRTRDATDPNIPSYQGINGLVTYDKTKPEGKRFAWTYGLRRWWKDETIRTTPDQNMLMERGHWDSSFTMLGMAADPNDPRRILLTTHSTLLFSPNIDKDDKVYQPATNRYYVNLYPRYARSVEANPNFKYATDPGMSRIRSTGLEVTVTYRVAIDPFDENHLILCMDDAGLANSHDGGETWYSLYRYWPKGPDMAESSDAVFDEGREGVVYALWHTSGAFKSGVKESLLTYKGKIMRSIDGGETWQDFSTGIPENACIADLEIVYPRDDEGNITDGERTMYVATMGYGFYVSHDSGTTFEPMNAGIPTIKTSGIDCVWGRSIQATGDGRLFAITEYSTLGPANPNGSTTYHSTQDPDSFGNVWEWNRNEWVRLPFNKKGAAFDNDTKSYKGDIQVRQPNSMYYDEPTRTLYVTGMCIVGPEYTKDGFNSFMNFGGGLYSYTSDKGVKVGEGTVAAIDLDSDLLGNERSLANIGRDSSGRWWLATEDGYVYVNRGLNVESGWEPVLEDTFCNLSEFDFGDDGTVFLTTRGVGALRIKPNLTLDGAGVKLSGTSFTYDGKRHDPTVTVELGSKTLVPGVDYTLSYQDASGKTIAASKVVGAGSYRVIVKGIGDFAGRAPSAEFTVKKATSKIVISKQAKAYTGKPIAYSGTVTRSGSGGKVTYAYFLDKACKSAVKASEVKAVGTYYVKATLSEDANHMGATSASVALTIAKASSTVKLAAQTKTYTGKSLSYSGKVTRSGSGGKVTYAYFSDKACQSAVKASAVKAVGAYYVKATLAGDANHAKATSAPVAFKIVKAANPMKVSTKVKTVKLGKAKALKKKTAVSGVVSVTKAQGKVTYAKVSVKGASKRLTVNKSNGKLTVAKGTKAGTYWIKVKVSAAGNAGYKNASKTVKATVKVR